MSKVEKFSVVEYEAFWKGSIPGKTWDEDNEESFIPDDEYRWTSQIRRVNVCHRSSTTDVFRFWLSDRNWANRNSLDPNAEEPYSFGQLSPPESGCCLCPNWPFLMCTLCNLTWPDITPAHMLYINWLILQLLFSFTPFYLARNLGCLPESN